MLGLSRLEAELAGALVMIAAFMIWLGFHDHAIRAGATAPIIAAQKAAQAQAQARAASAASSQAAALKDAHDESTFAWNRAAELDDVVQRMRDDTVRRRAAGPIAAASGGSNPGIGEAADMVPRGLLIAAYAEADDSASDAADLARVVGQLRVSGQLCVRDYDALR